MIDPTRGVLRLGSLRSRTGEGLVAAESSASLSGSEMRTYGRKRHRNTWVTQPYFLLLALGYHLQTCHTERSVCAQHRWTA